MTGWTRSPRRRHGSRNASVRPRLEALECRALLATITVTGTGDTIASDGVVTLREAITAANTNAASGDAPAGGTGLDTIAFNIPGAGPHTINLTSPLPDITEAVTINGQTQPGFASTPLIVLNGVGAGVNASGLTITAADSTVQGLVIQGFNQNGILITGGNATGNVVRGNFIGTNATGTQPVANGNAGVLIKGAPNNTVGGLTAGARNLISGNGSVGVEMSDPGATGNVVQGNFIGTDVTGAATLGNSVQSTGVDIFTASNDLIGGAAAGARNIISGNITGVEIDGTVAQGATGNKVQGNYIGIDVTGTKVVGNIVGGEGVAILAASGNLIGGTGPGEGNVISGNQGRGLDITGLSSVPANNNLVQGNLIGTDASGTAALPNGEGILINGINTIGGTASGAGNLITNNKGNGVTVSSVTNTHVAMLGNSIFGNTKVGIDLGNDGVTPNTPGGPHIGPNDLQNFPILTSADNASGVTKITGTLNSTANTTFTVEFFANPVANPGGINEGQFFLGRLTNVTTDANGNASFTFNTASALPPGQVITATATDPNGNTSEFFAPGVVVTGAQPAAADIVLTTFTGTPNPVVAGQLLTYTITAKNNGPSAATNVVLTDSPLPANVQFVSASAGTFDAANNRVVASLGSLPVGGTATVTIVVRPTAAAAGTTLVNTVAVTAAETDPNPANNVGRVVTTAVTSPTPPPGGDTTGPTVVSLQRFGFHARPTRLVLTFSEALDPARATNLANYRLTGPRGAAVRIRSATYDPTAHAVTLLPSRLLSLNQVFRLLVNGTSSGSLTDLAGNALDGNADGRPGGDFTGRIDRSSLADFPVAPARAALVTARRHLASHR
jgi:uncharacterized repeat protein (TIGR01451 family)